MEDHQRSSSSSSSSSSTSSSSSSSLTNPFKSPSTSQRVIYSDRFIPSRIGSNFDLFDLSPPPQQSSSPAQSPSGERENHSGPYSTLLRSVLFGPLTPDRPTTGRTSLLATPPSATGLDSSSSPSSSSACSSSSSSSSVSPFGRNIFRFKSEVIRRSLFTENQDGGLADAVASPPKAPRKVPRSPYKVLDAPGLQDDFYLNLVDWSPNNVLAVGLGNCVYLWNACTSKVVRLCNLGSDDSVCSVSWAQRGNLLAVGTNLGKVQKIRTMEGHRLRVGALAWSPSTLSSGSRDKTILQRDIRAQEDFLCKLSGHKSEVCGLKWSYDNRELASGGNDNRLFVWNHHSTQPVQKYCEHTAAVKAIAWSPHLHGLLASGGGTADRCIRFWNTTTNAHLSCVDTGSQVCNLVWSKNVNELVSTHGYSQNQIIVWRYPSMSKIATLIGHTLRVLYLAISPDGQTIVTGAGDETLRFWNVFPSPKFQSNENDIGSSSLGRSQIR
ncbi:B-type cell cycle switch protein ccs52A-like isoform X2 [Wolffia australiana]